jgi:phasin family protein
MNQNTNPFADAAKAIENFKLPGVDMTAIVESRRKDIEALTEANKAVYDMMQELARKQSEMLAQAMKDVQGAASGVGLGDPVKQAELARKACEKALADMKELAEIARKSQSDAMASITKRATESMQEGKKAVQKPPAARK